MNSAPDGRRANYRWAWLAVWLIAAAKFALHFYFNNRYGYFRDEFNYIACGEHLDWGFVDHPPLIPLAVKLSRMLFGDSLRVIRLVPAIASSLMVVQAAALARRLMQSPVLARRMNGTTYAMLLTAATIALAPIYLSAGSLLTTNCLEPLLWMGCVYFAIRAVQDDPRFWLAFGATAGLGMEEKYSIAVLGGGIVFGLLLTPHRRALASRWIWLGGALALLIFLPNLLWNIQHHWPFLEVMRNIRATGKDVVLSPPRFFLEQMLLLGPVSAPLWLGGLGALLWWRRLRPFRFLGWCYLFTFAFFELSHGKNYYLAPVYPMLFAAGSAALAASSLRWLKSAAPLAILSTNLVLVPLVVPVLSPEKLSAYLDSLPFEVPRSEVSFAGASLPQHYADQFGWQEMVDVVARGWATLSPEERAHCGIFAQNYGQAGAIDLLGSKLNLGLPPALSGHQTYYLWGTHGYSGNCLIVTGDGEARLRQLFELVEKIGESSSAYAMEKRIPVYLCKRAKFGSLEAIWPKIKLWR